MASEFERIAAIAHSLYVKEMGKLGRPVGLESDIDQWPEAMDFIKSHVRGEIMKAVMRKCCDLALTLDYCPDSYLPADIREYVPASEAVS